MRRTSVVLSLLLGLSILAAQPASAHTIDRCRFGPAFTVTAVQRTIGCALYWMPVRAGAATVRCIANRESHFHARSVNRSSGAAGVFQMIPSTWWAWSHRMPAWDRWWGVGADVLNARNNVLTAVRVMSHQGLGAWGGGC